MAGIYFSYVWEDRYLASQLVADLEAKGHTAAWLHRMRTEWGAPPPLDVDGATKLIVLWTETSVGSPFLRQEAFAAADAGKLVQLRADTLASSQLPRGLGRAGPIIDPSDLAGIIRALSSEAPQVEPDRRFESMPRASASRIDPSPPGYPPFADFPITPVPTPPARTRPMKSTPEHTVTQIGRAHV